jgi:hypothetical protein
LGHFVGLSWNEQCGLSFRGTLTTSSVFSCDLGCLTDWTERHDCHPFHYAHVKKLPHGVKQFINSQHRELTFGGGAPFFRLFFSCPPPC